jgi:hypothetical protein
VSGLSEAEWKELADSITYHSTADQLAKIVCGIVAAHTSAAVEQAEQRAADAEAKARVYELAFYRANEAVTARERAAAYSDGDRERSYIDAHTTGRLDELDHLLAEVAPHCTGFGGPLRTILERRRDEVAGA